MGIGDRIKERLEAEGLSQTELARRVGVSQQTIWKLIKGESHSSAHLHKIARELRTTADYLAGDTSDPDPQGAPAPTARDVAEQLNSVLVAEVDLEFGMGGSYLDDHVESRPIPFPATWIRRFTQADPEHLAFVRGQGDSMVPTLMDGDIALIDRSQQAISRQDSVWAVAFGEIGMIKRIRAMPDGSYKILSDNPSVDPETAVDDEMFVIGRVVAILRKM